MNTLQPLYLRMCAAGCAGALGMAVVRPRVGAAACASVVTCVVPPVGVLFLSICSARGT